MQENSAEAGSAERNVINLKGQADQGSGCFDGIKMGVDNNDRADKKSKTDTHKSPAESFVLFAEAVADNNEDCTQNNKYRPENV